MKPQQITIKYTKGLDTGTQVINEKDYYKAKARLENNPEMLTLSRLNQVCDILKIKIDLQIK